LVIGGMCLAALAASGSLVLREFSRRQLEIYCRRRRRRDRFGEILASHDHLAESASMIQVAAGTVALLAVGGLLPRLLSAAVHDSWYQLGLVLLLAVMLMIALFNWIPQGLARFWSAPFLFHTWTFWKLLAVATFPLTWLGGLVESLFGRLCGQLVEEPDDEEAFEDEIRTMVTVGQREGLLEADAREMIESVMELSDQDVSDIMTPRAQVDALDATLPWPDILRFVVEVGRTRIPVYEGSLDNIVGILYVKDLLLEFAKGQREPWRPLADLLRKAWFVPTSKKVDELLRDFLDIRNHMAIVLDEYRSVAGVVTIEDALEEIVGEIVDESDKDEEEEILQLDESTAEALGHTHLDEINERLGLNLPEPEELDTIGGLVVRQLNSIPRDGDSIVAGNTRITVLKANRRRVQRVRLESLREPQRDAPPNGAADSGTMR
jgi:CBS domain containing-hemolysin-like protein